MVNAIERLIAVMADVTVLRKDQVNKHQHFKFRGIDDVMNVVGPALRKHGLVVLPEVVEHTHETNIPVGSNRTPMAHAIVHMRYQFASPDDTEVEIEAVGEAFDSGDKATSKAMAMAYKYALFQALCLPTDEEDADAATHVRAPVEPPAENPDSQAARDELLRYAAANRIRPKDIAEGFQAQYNVPIQQGTVEQIREYQIGLQAGGTVVATEQAAPEQAGEPA